MNTDITKLTQERLDAFLISCAITSFDRILPSHKRTVGVVDPTTTWTWHGYVSFEYDPYYVKHTREEWEALMATLPEEEWYPYEMEMPESKTYRMTAIEAFGCLDIRLRGVDLEKSSKDRDELEMPEQEKRIFLDSHHPIRSDFDMVSVLIETGEISTNRPYPPVETHLTYK